MTAVLAWGGGGLLSSPVLQTFQKTLILGILKPVVPRASCPVCSNVSSCTVGAWPGASALWAVPAFAVGRPEQC